MRLFSLRALAAAAVITPAFLASGGGAQASLADCGAGGSTAWYSFTGSLTSCQVTSGGVY